MKPGVTNLPAPSMTCAPGGTVTDDRGPTALMRRPETTMVPSRRGGPPLPSMMTAPTMATAAGGAWPATPISAKLHPTATQSASAMRRPAFLLTMAPPPNMTTVHLRPNRARGAQASRQSRPHRPREVDHVLVVGHDLDVG